VVEGQRSEKFEWVLGRRHMRELLGRRTSLGGAREQKLLGRRTSLGGARERVLERVERERKRRGSEPRATRASEPTARAGARHELGSGRAERREKGKSRLLFFFYGFCVNACGKAPVGLK